MALVSHVTLILCVFQTLELGNVLLKNFLWGIWLLLRLLNSCKGL